jgi:hypothetical protein
LVGEWSNIVVYYNITMDIILKEVDAFLKLCNLEKETVIAFCKEQKNLTNAIIVACASVYNNKKHSHQKRIKSNILEDFGIKVTLIIKEIENVKTFDNLLNLINNISLNGIGPLAKYDIALRIGFYKKIYPSKIYLHAGTKKGTEILLRKKIKDKYISKETLTKIYPNLEKLTCAELEVYLCVFPKKNNCTSINKICK